MPENSFFSRHAKALQSYLDPRQVGYLILYVTNRCNFRCRFCFYAKEIDKGLKADELTLEELIKISKKIGPLAQLSITGGEPFLRKDLDQIASAFIENTGVRYLTIPTNASMPGAMVNFLEKVLPEFPHSYFRVAFSIEGIGESHDEFRSMPGSFKKIQESYLAISPLRQRFKNLVLDSNSVFTASTEDSLLDALKRLSTDFEFDNLSVTYARGDMRDPALKQMSKDNYIKINSFLETLARKKEKRFLYPLVRGVRDVSRDFLVRTVFNDEFVATCVAGRKMLVLGETGQVYPCEILNQPMGDIRNYDYDMKALLARPENRQLVRWIVSSKCKCSFECALAANVLWSISSYPKLIKSAIRNIGQETSARNSG